MPIVIDDEDSEPTLIDDKDENTDEDVEMSDDDATAYEELQYERTDRYWKNGCAELELSGAKSTNSRS
jgi:hypothetical protein